MIRILHGTELTLEQDGLTFLQCLTQELGSIRHIRCDHVSLTMHLLEELIVVDFRCMIKLTQDRILDFDDLVQTILKDLLIEELVYLKTDLRILVGEERRDTGLRGAIALTGESRLLERIEQNVIWHHDLCTVGYQDLRGRNAGVDNGLQLCTELLDIECNTVSEYGCGVIIEYAARHKVE